MAKCGLMPEGDLSWFNFSWASRIYSSASVGVAILLAAGLSGWRKPSARLLGKAAALVIIGFMAVFHAGLSLDWREAAEIRNDLIRSLVSQVPEVRSGTNFVFLDINCSHKRAEVIRRENGLPRTDRDALRGSYSVCVARLSPRISLARPCVPTGGSHARGISEPRPEAGRTSPTGESAPVQEVGAGVGSSGHD